MISRSNSVELRPTVASSPENHRHNAPVWRPSTLPVHVETPGRTSANTGSPAAEMLLLPAAFPFHSGSPLARLLAFPLAPPQAPVATSESVAVRSDPRSVLPDMPSIAGGESNRNIPSSPRHILLGTRLPGGLVFPSGPVAPISLADTRTNNLQNPLRRSVPRSTAWPSAPLGRGSSEWKAGEPFRRLSVSRPFAAVGVDSAAVPAPREVGRETVPRPPLRWPRTSPRLCPGRRRSAWPAHRRRGVSLVYRRARTAPKIATMVQPSP